VVEGKPNPVAALSDPLMESPQKLVLYANPGWCLWDGLNMVFLFGLFQ
jgi:hypothetical protein